MTIGRSPPPPLEHLEVAHNLLVEGLANLSPCDYQVKPIYNILYRHPCCMILICKTRQEKSAVILACTTPTPGVILYEVPLAGLRTYQLSTLGTFLLA